MLVSLLSSLFLKVYLWHSPRRNRVRQAPHGGVPQIGTYLTQSQRGFVDLPANETRRAGEVPAIAVFQFVHKIAQQAGRVVTDFWYSSMR
jgi:hypothetical protein